MVSFVVGFRISKVPPYFTIRTVVLALSIIHHHVHPHAPATMGTVHGVYLKYVGLSALSYIGYAYLARNEEGNRASSASDLESRLLVENATQSAFSAVPALVCGYSAVLNGVIAVLFKMERGMALIGKNKRNGQIPIWSKVIFFPFHIPTLLYTHIHTRMHEEKVPVVSEVIPGWWVGGCYGHEIDTDWYVPALFSATRSV